ncbi:MAG: DUF1269 domain-containing protein [Nannocystaceae bacterium]|nr:DUF1269 domain-containing protein [bacterium]
MSTLIAVAFPGVDDAERVRSQLLDLQHAHLIDLEDAAVVIKRADGRVSLRQLHNLAARGAASGGVWGLLLGALFAAPLLGAALGAASGALGGALSDIGVDDDFMRDIGRSLKEESSALFILVRRATPDRVLQELEPLEGTVLQTSLSFADEAKLRAALEGAGASEHALPAA